MNIRNRALKLKVVFIVAAAATLIACTNSSAPSLADKSIQPSIACGSAPAANIFTEQQLLQDAIHINIPANEWRAIRLQGGSELTPAEGSPTFFIRADAQDVAKPWVGIGSQFFDAPADSCLVSTPADFQFRALTNGEPSTFTFGIGAASTDEARFEFVIVVGSNDGPTSFDIGLFDDAAGKSMASASTFTQTPDKMIRSRRLETEPTFLKTGTTSPDQVLEANVQSGLGGYAGEYLRYFDQDGSLVSKVSGALAVQDAPLLPVEGSIQSIKVAGNKNFQNTGAWSYLVIGVPRGVFQWRYLMSLPPFMRLAAGAAGSNGDAGTGGEVASEPRPPRTGSLLAAVSGPGQSGPATFSLDLALTSGPIGPDLEFAQPLVLAAWGFVPADFGELYGWNVANSETLVISGQ